ncbi:MAG: CubicO group peptidase (beta-lactamase class C family) [Oleiphilaceae bacterium]|jgi:CubicO group peptidase (beta-lactamase class C family)
MVAGFGVGKRINLFSHMNNKGTRIGNLIHLPDSLSEVTTIDRAHEFDPASVGMTAEGLESIWRSVEGIYETGTHPGISLSMRRQGKVVLSRAIGHSRGNGPHSCESETKVLMRPATPVCFFSASKAVTAFLIHLLNEDKLINLHDPVSFYAPEFGANGKKNITIHQVLSHRSGVPGLPAGVPIETLWNNDEVWKLLCDSKLSMHRGDKLAYHALTGGYILERVLQTVTGKTIQQFLDERVRKPMGMKYFRYGVDDKYAEVVADTHATGFTPVFPVSNLIKRALGGSVETIEEVSNDQRFKRAVIPAGNIMGTAEEMGNFFQMLLNNGVWEGKQICQPMTVKRLTQEYGSIQFDRTLMLPMRYSAGLMLGGSPFGMWGRKSAESFGHIGLINKLCWADPVRNLSVSLQTTGVPFLANNIPSFVRFMNSLDRHCPRDSLL